MTDYTPETDEVRTVYLGYDAPYATGFDRWLNEERAKAWDKGQHSGWIEGYSHGDSEPNPYRKADQ